MPANAAIVTLNVKTFVLSANGKCTVDSIVVTDPGPGGPENKARVVYRNGVLYFKNRGNSSLSVQFVITSTDTNAPTIKATGITLALSPQATLDSDGSGNFPLNGRIANTDGSLTVSDVFSVNSFPSWKYTIAVQNGADATAVGIIDPGIENTDAE